jgi:uncharacterized lipoprotein YddW (UPF0748 family)
MARKKFKKGVWLHSIPDLGGKQGIERFVKRYADAGFDLLVPAVKNFDGRVDYHSRIADVNPPSAKWDPLEYMAGVARKSGIKIHTWFCVNPEGQKGAFLRAHPEYAALTPDGKKAKCGDGYFTCLARPEVRNYKVRLMAEVAERYDVAGIHLDYIRTGDNVCFCKSCAAKFKKIAGVDFKKSRWYQRESPAWYQWRINNVTKIVSAVSAKCKKYKKELSAAVYHAHPYTMVTQSQDFPRWCREGYLDMVAPMTYTSDPEMMRYYTKNHVANMEGKTELWEGLITGGRRSKGKPDWVFEEARIAKKLGAQGVMIFEHHGINDALLKKVAKL